MNWLIRTRAKKLEVWSDTEYQSRLFKCEYYGARPFWKKIRKLDPPSHNEKPSYSIGEVIPYKRSALSKRFAVIIDLFTESGQLKYLGIDIENKNQVIAPIIS